MTENIEPCLNARISSVDPSTSTRHRAEPVEELRKWKILKDVPEVLLHQIRYAMVASRSDILSSYDYALLMTHDDQAYVIGDNRYGQIGLDKRKKYADTPTKVEELSGLGIIGFSASYYCVAAWTRDGKLFMMGQNGDGKLGQGHQRELKSVHQVFKRNNLKVVKAACGGEHTLCATTDGNVYAWGLNELRQCTPQSVNLVTTPTQITFLRDTIKISDVACTRDSSFALTDDGNLYAWGCNENGETGVGSAEKSVKISTKIPIPNSDHVINISCGWKHCIALTRTGTIFAWGSNVDGEVGTGTKEDRYTPIKLDIANVRRISATNGKSDSVCKTFNGKIFAWGESLNSDRPKRTEFKSINDCRGHYGMGMSETWVSKYSLDTMEPDCLSFFKLQANMKKITFLVDGTKITTSKFYLKRCAVMQEKLKQEWKRELEKNGVITIPGFNAKQFGIFINFLQTDRIIAATVNDLIDLLNLAHFFKMEKFRHAVIDMMKKEMSVENVVQFYFAALQHEDKTLHWDTISFIKPRILEFMGKVNLTNLDSTIVVKILAELQALGAFTIP